MTPETLRTLLLPYLDLPAPPAVYGQLSVYLDLLLRWNARTNLTAIREPEEIVRRHFGESLFAARHLPSGTETERETGTQTLLDLGSGAGFPGLPIQILRPALHVTLAESQHKKASFLREVIRTLGLPTEVHAARAETLPSSRLFDVVTLRAVDDTAAALEAAVPRVRPGGHLLYFTSTGSRKLPKMVPSEQTAYPIPGTLQSVLECLRF